MFKLRKRSISVWLIEIYWLVVKVYYNILD